jgi:flavin-dependent dehydrogenase
VGCDAGFLNVSRIKGSHAAIKTGMLAAEAAYDAVTAGRQHDELSAYPTPSKTAGCTTSCGRPATSRPGSRRA